MHGIVVGLLGFFVNYLLLLGTTRWLDTKISTLRMAFGALLGGFSTAACFLPGFGFLGHFLWRVVLIGLTALIAFWEHPKEVRLFPVFVLMNLSLHGIAMGIGKGGIWAVLVCFASIFLVRILDREIQPARFASVCITHGGRRVELTALNDTGNTLRDPISGHKVLVVDEKIAQRLLGLSPDALRKPLETMSSAAVPGLRLIPYHSVGNPGGMMLGIRAEEVLLDGVRCERIIAFAPHRFGNGKGYEALSGGI